LIVSRICLRVSAMHSSTASATLQTVNCPYSQQHHSLKCISGYACCKQKKDFHCCQTAKGIPTRFGDGSLIRCFLTPSVPQCTAE
jgi:hypothetical protein